ncbi:MAG TPA: hypothetical protein VF914_08000 [Chloroflexia bacterium]|jgi:hypothetical protein
MNSFTDKLLDGFDRLSRAGFLNSVVAKTLDRVLPRGVANAACGYQCGGSSCYFSDGCYYATNGARPNQLVRDCTKTYAECFYGGTHYTDTSCVSSCP